MEQLEAQTREMNQIIAELEERKTSSDEELKSKDEKISLLRDIINNLESQIEQKSTYESEILEQLENMKRTIDDRDSKMRVLLGELESLRSEKVEQSDVMCVKCGQEEDRYEELMVKIKEQVIIFYICFFMKNSNSVLPYHDIQVFFVILLDWNQSD